MGLHEPAWWAWPEHYERFDRVYMKLALPLYIKKSKYLFPISQFVVDECRKYIDAPFTNVMIAYPAPKEYFKKIEDTKILGAIREEYNLPEHFVFSTTRVDHPGLDNSTSFFPGKNPETTARAFIRCKKEIAIPHKLVIAGRRVRDYFLHLGFSKEEFSDIHFLDFVPHQDLPAILNLSDLFVLPSYYESYAMALVEAIACGCPVIAANTGACPEITSGAGILADPHDFKDFASKIKQVLIDSKLNNELRRKSIERAAFFNWTRTAKEILNKMEKVHESATKGRST
jgi:glycosyltransferase involved in cell wall biosynthesis